jgi:alkylation response protein AidB-like acyl-CoA dehydrogenase
MYSLHLSAEQLEIRDTVRDFVTRKVRQVALRAERLEAPQRQLLTETLDQASQMGLRTLALSEERGGAGADALTSAIVAEELAIGDIDVAAVLGETSLLGRLLFDRLMTAEQRERFLPAFLSDDSYHLALADEADSDGALGVNYHRPVRPEEAVKATAVRASNGDWVLSGVKHCVANAPIAKLIAIRANTKSGAADAGSSILLVPRDTPGLSVRAEEDANAWFHGTCGEVVLADCRVPAENLLAPGSARAIEETSAGHALTQFSAMNLGVGRAAYEAALDYAQLRIQGGRRIIEHQAIGTKLAEIAIRLEVARSAIWQAAWASDHPDAYADRSLADLPLAAMAQVFTAESVYHATKDAAEVFGAMGVMKDMPLQKYVRDTLIFLHSGHGADDAKLRIAEVLARYQRPSAVSAHAAE